jgi:phage protein D
MSATPRFAPEFRVSIDGAPVPSALRASVSAVSLQTGLEGVDRLELTLVNENLRWLDHPLLRLDRRVAISLCYAPDVPEQMFVGEIVGHQAAFPASGTPTLTVVAQDRRHHMQRGNRSRWFAISIPEYGNLPIPDGAVAALVTAEHNMIPLADPVAAALAVLLGSAQVAIALDDPDAGQKTIRKQTGESDFDFLARIALENGWETLVDHEGPAGGFQLRFFSPADRLTPALSLKWGRDLIEFSPRITNVGQVATVTIPIWIPAMKTEFTVSVGWDWDRQSLDLSINPGFGPPPSGGDDDDDADHFTLLGHPVTLADAPRTILGELLPRLNRRLTASGSTIGDPRMRAGSVLRVEGVGERFGGLYRMTSVTHTFDSGGWRTSFEARKEIWFGSIPLPEQGAVPVRVAM